MGDAELAAFELSQLVELLAAADRYRGRTTSAMSFPMETREYDRVCMALYTKSANAGSFVYPVKPGQYPPPRGHEGREGLWLMGVWVERAET